MDPIQDPETVSISKVERVRQAASVLGISERTVYRRLRSGKLDQWPAEKRGAGTVTTSVSDERIVEIVLSQIAPHMDRFSCQNDMTNDNLAALRQELARRDAQIESLLQNQQELTCTIQKLQEQIYELARLALERTAPSGQAEREVVQAVSTNAVDNQRGGNTLKRWLRSLRQRYRVK